MLATVVFGLAAGCLVALCAGMVVTLVSGVRLWPPAGDAWKRRWYVVLTRSFVVLFAAVGLVDWGGGALPWPERVAPGVVVFGAGVVLLVRSAADLGAAGTNGQAGRLHTEGLYSYTRNPQNVAYTLVFVGFVAVTNSRLAAVLALGTTVFLVLQSLVEEPWLAERYGTAYVEYCREVPRFTGVRSFRRALDRGRE